MEKVKEGRKERKKKKKEMKFKEEIKINKHENR